MPDCPTLSASARKSGGNQEDPFPQDIETKTLDFCNIDPAFVEAHDNITRSEQSQEGHQQASTSKVGRWAYRIMARQADRRRDGELQLCQGLLCER